jgi:hypothetical protein
LILLRAAVTDVGAGFGKEANVFERLHTLHLKTRTFNPEGPRGACTLIYAINKYTIRRETRILNP